MALQRRVPTLLAFALTILGLAVVAPVGPAADEDRGVLASLISRALSTPTTRVAIGRIDGALSSDAVIHDVEISDRDGVWLKLDRARIVWRRLALLNRRLEIDGLEVNQLDIARRPVPAEAPVPGEDQPLLPELPVKVEVKSFALAELKLAEPILGTAARISASGAAKLGNPSEGLDLRVSVRRLDQPGTLTTRLGLIPEGQQLNLTLALDEPAGGLLARAADIPGLPPVKLDLSGHGTLDAFQAKLAFEAGAAIGASGNATLTRDGPTRRLGLDLAAQISGLLPSVAAPVFAGTTKLSGTVAFADDGSVMIPGITLAATAAKLDVTGSIDARQLADLKITAANVPTGESLTTVASADIRHLALDGRITGALTAPIIDATLTAEAARLPAGRLGKLDATFKATPTGDASAKGPLIQLTADARATGLTLTDKALAQAVGTEASLRLRGTGTLNGQFTFETLELKSPTITGQFAGRAGSSEIQGRLGIAAPDLAKFGEVAGLGLRGSARLDVEVEGTPRANRFNVKLEGHATQFATGIAAVDGLFGGRLDVRGGVQLEPNGSVGFDGVRLSGAHAQGSIAGAATPERADVAVGLTIPTLARADDRLTGRAEIDAKLTGTLEHPGATARIAISDATALGRPAPRLALEATAKNIRSALDAHVTLEGEIDRKPARGDLHVRRQAGGGGTTIEGADITIGSVDLRGSLTLDRQNVAIGQATVKARDLDNLSPLVLKKLAGTLEADVSLTAVNGGQNVQLTAAGQRIEANGFRLDRLDTNLSLTDVYRSPVVVGTAEIDQASIGGEAISRVRLKAQGTPQASDVTLTAAARAFNLDARARIIPGDPIRIEVAQFGATRGKQRVALAQPTTLTVVDGGVDIGTVALGLGSGRLMLSGLAGSHLALKADARAIPLSAVEIFAPGLGVAGTLNGSAEISGAASTPTGTYRLHLANLATPQTRSAGLPPIDAAASGRIEETRATVEATVSAERAGTLKVGGSAPLARTGSLDLTVRGNLDVGRANTLLGASGRRVTGSVAIDGRVAGTLDQPQASGAATLAGGSFSDAAQGTQLDNIRGRLVAR